MNILVVVNSLKIGGGENVAVSLANAMSSFEDVNVTLLNVNYCNFDELNPLESKISEKVDYLKLSTSSFKPGSRVGRRIFRHFYAPIYKNILIKKIAGIIKEKKIDIVNSHLFHTDRLIYKIQLSVPWIITNHGCYHQDHLKNRHEALETADNVICVSNFSQKLILNLFPLVKNTTVIYNGYKPVDSSLFHITRQNLGIESDAFVFVMVARGEYLKGWSFAVEAFIKFKYSQKSYLICVGDGDEIQKLLNEPDIKSNVRIKFVGYQDVPQQFLNISNAVVLPSLHHESLPMSLVEGIYQNLPLIATNRGGMPEVVQNELGDCGILVDFKDKKPDIDKLVLAFEQIIENYDNYKANTVHNQIRFSEATFAINYYNLFKSSIASGKK